jgi:hypothetical protein
MRRRLTIAALIGVVALAGCSDNNQEIPTGPQVQLDKGVPCPTTVFPLSQANEQITALFPAGTKKSSPRADALAKAKDISEKWSRCKVADPQGKVVTFVNGLLSDFRAGRLIVYATSPTTAERVSALINTMYSGVGFGTPNLPVDPETGTDFGIGFFTPGQPLLVRTNLNDAAASLPGDAFTETTAITIILRPNTPNPFDATGRTVLPPFFEITASNLSGTHYLANGRAVVGFCVDEETVLNQLSEPAIAHLAVAEGTNPGGFEVVDEASSAQYDALGLNCERFVPAEIGSLFGGGLKGFASAAAAMLLPARLEAAVGKKGLGGLPSSLSPFGVTDRLGNPGSFTPLSPAVNSEPSGATVTRTVHISNQNGTPAANVPVTFSTTSGGLGGSQPVPTDASGNASVSWTLTGVPGIYTLTATISDEAFAPSSLTFTVAEASSEGELTALPCSLEGQITSLNSLTETSVVFDNQTTDDLSVFWLDFAGQRVLYNTVGAGTSYAQPTFLTHPWILITGAGEGEVCHGIFLPLPTEATARVGLVLE